MTTQEALQKIRKRGFSLTYRQLRYLITRGNVPAPHMTPSLVWDWSEDDVENVVSALHSREAEKATT